MFNLSTLPSQRVLFLGLLFFVIAVFCSVGYHHPDEHFQLLEFASYKHGTSPAYRLPWEFGQQMRPTAQVFVAYTVHGMLGAHDPFLTAWVLRLLTALLVGGVILLSYDTFAAEIKNEWVKRFYGAMAILFWFVPFLGVRFSSETWSGLFFLWGFVLWHRLGKNSMGLGQVFSIGVLMGLSFIFRYQAGFLAVGFGIWLLAVAKLDFKKWVFFVLGGVLMLLIGALSDYWFYGKWVSTAWNYLAQNVIENKAANFGVEPIWEYIYRGILMPLPPLGLFIVGGLIGFMLRFPKHPLTWSIIPFLLIHHLIGHKEYRFMFVMANLVPIWSAFLLDSWAESQSRLFQFFKKYALPVCVVLNGLLLFAFCIKPADFSTLSLRYVYRSYDAQTQIFYRKMNLYTLGGMADFNFYKPRGAQVTKLWSMEELESKKIPDMKYILVADNTQDVESELRKANVKYQKVYCNFPDWMFEYVNFGNWLKREDCWNVYEVYP